MGLMFGCLLISLAILCGVSSSPTDAITGKLIYIGLFRARLKVCGYLESLNIFKPIKVWEDQVDMHMIPWGRYC